MFDSSSSTRLWVRSSYSRTCGIFCTILFFFPHNRPSHSSTTLTFQSCSAHSLLESEAVCCLAWASTSMGGFVIQVFIVRASFNSSDKSSFTSFCFWCSNTCGRLLSTCSLKCKLMPCLNSLSTSGIVKWHKDFLYDLSRRNKITGLIRKLKLYPSLNAMLFKAFEPTSRRLSTVEAELAQSLGGMRSTQRAFIYSQHVHTQIAMQP